MFYEELTKQIFCVLCITYSLDCKDHKHYGMKGIIVYRFHNKISHYTFFFSYKDIS